YQNARGLRSKLSTLFMDSFTFSSHVIVFTETWLKPDILSSEVLADRYTIYRNDRSSRRGGGVLIAVNSNFTSELFIVQVSQDLEFLCVRLILPGQSIYVTCSYIPPSSDVLIYEQHLSALKTVSSSLSDKDHLIVLGDFNLP
ncbi:Hypothetical predicted protein, partial [Drosophila guanche]